MVLDGEVLKCPGGQWYEPITETRVFVRFPNRKQRTNFVLSVFHLGKKKNTKPANRLGVSRSVLFHMSPAPIKPIYMSGNPITMYG